MIERLVEDPRTTRPDEPQHLPNLRLGGPIRGRTFAMDYEVDLELPGIRIEATGRLIAYGRWRLALRILPALFAKDRPEQFGIGIGSEM